MTATAEQTWSSPVQGELWGARASDWAAIQEPAQRDYYPPVFDAAGVGAGTRLLDAGCGSGVGAEIAAERGAAVSALDAAAALVEIARGRVPSAEIRVGELEALPYDDETFDVVTGFNAFQYATSPVNALREARRVTRPGGSVAAVVWGRPEQSEAVALVKALAGFLPPPPPGAAGPFALSEPGALESLLAEAGLVPATGADVPSVWTYPDVETAVRGGLASGPAARAVGIAGEDAVRDAMAEALAPYVTSDGGVRLENVFRYCVATV